MRYARQFIAVSKSIVAVILIVFAAWGSARAAILPISTYCSGLCGIAWSPVEDHLLGAVDNLGLWLYDASEEEQSPQLFPQENARSFSFDPLGRYVAVASCPGLDPLDPQDECKGLISLFDLQQHIWKPLGAYDYDVDNIKFSPDGSYVAYEKAAGSVWGIQVIDIETKETFSIADHNLETYFMADADLVNIVMDYVFDPQSKLIAISNGDRGWEGHIFFGISVWRLFDQVLQAHTQDSLLAPTLAFTGTDAEIMFIEHNTQVSVWNYRTGSTTPLGSMVETGWDNLHRLSFSDPPTNILAALVDRYEFGHRRLYVWDIQSGETDFFFDAPKDGFVDLIAMNPTDEYIAYGSTVDEAKIVTIWDQETGSVVRRIMLTL
jgi:WD40 repeat protein